jgi:hypothetical protein
MGNPKTKIHIPSLSLTCSKLAELHQSLKIQIKQKPSRLLFSQAYGPAGVEAQSSSVMLDQNTQTITTESKVNNVSNKAPSIFPLVPLHIYRLIVYWNICPKANRTAAARRYTFEKGS